MEEICVSIIAVVVWLVLFDKYLGNVCKLRKL